MGLTAQGYEKRKPEDLKEVIVKELQNVGSPFLDLPADIQNNIIDTTIPVLMQFENIAAEIINGYGPDYANDYIWFNLANSLGLLRKSKVKASVELKFTGSPGTYIPKDTEVGAFKTDESITLDSTGSALVQAYSEDDTFAEAESLTEINATIADDLKVVNPEASIKALSEESVADLRQRAKTILRSSRKGGIDYALARLKAVKGVNPQLIKFRFLDYNYQVTIEDIEVLKNVQGIEAIIGGGDANQVAGVLFDSFLETAKLISEPSNNEAERSVEAIVKYYGSNLPIKFTRPKNLPLKFRMIFTFRDVLVTSTSAEGIIKQPLTEFINNRQLGAPLNKNTLDMFIFSKFADHGIDTTGFVKIDYTITNGEELVEFDSEGFIAQIKHDCYLTLAGLQIEIASGASRQEFGNGNPEKPGGGIVNPPSNNVKPPVEDLNPDGETSELNKNEPQIEEPQTEEPQVNELEELKKDPDVVTFEEEKERLKKLVTLAYHIYRSSDRNEFVKYPMSNDTRGKLEALSKSKDLVNIDTNDITFQNAAYKMEEAYREKMFSPEGKIFECDIDKNTDHISRRLTATARGAFDSFLWNDVVYENIGTKIPILSSMIWLDMRDNNVIDDSPDPDDRFLMKEKVTIIWQHNRMIKAYQAAKDKIDRIEELEAQNG